MKKSVPSRPALERPGCQDRTFSAVHQTGVHDEQTDDPAKKARLPFRVIRVGLTMSALSPLFSR